MSKNYEKPWSVEEMIERAPNWSLAGDAGLLKHLEAFSENLFKKAAETNDNLNNLLDNLNSTSIQLDLVKNEFLGLQNTQFIESRVYEDDETLGVDTNVSVDKKTSDEDRKTALKDAVLEGLDILDKYYDRVSLPASDSEDDGECISHVLRPRDPYLSRPLPYVIGSEDWYRKWHIGLEDSSSDSETEQQPAETFSDSDSESALPVTDRRGVSTSDSGTDLSTNRNSDRPMASSTFNDTRVESSDSEEFNNSLPVSAPISNVSFAEQLSAKLGDVVVQSRQEEEPVINNRPLQKQPQTYSRNVGDLFANEPPPLDDSDDGLYGTTSGKGKFSGGDGLFDESDDEGNSFWGQKGAAKPKVTTTEATIKKPSGLFDDDEDDIFKGVSTQAQRRVPKDDLFADTDSDDDDMFATAATSDTSRHKSILTPFGSDPPPFLNDEPPDIVTEKKKPTNGVFVYGGAHPKLGAFLPKRRPSSSDESGPTEAEPTNAHASKPPTTSQPPKKLSLFDDPDFQDDDLFTGGPDLFGKPSGLGLFDTNKQLDTKNTKGKQSDTKSKQSDTKTKQFDTKEKLFDSNEDLFEPKSVAAPTKSKGLFDDDSDDDFYMSNKAQSSIFSDSKTSKLFDEDGSDNKGSLFGDSKTSKLSNDSGINKTNSNLFGDIKTSKLFEEDDVRDKTSKSNEDGGKNEPQLSIFDDSKKSKLFKENDISNKSNEDGGSKNEPASSLFDDNKTSKLFDEDGTTNITSGSQSTKDVVENTNNANNETVKSESKLSNTKPKDVKPPAFNLFDNIPPDLDDWDTKSDTFEDDEDIFDVPASRTSPPSNVLRLFDDTPPPIETDLPRQPPTLFDDTPPLIENESRRKPPMLFDDESQPPVGDNSRLLVAKETPRKRPSLFDDDSPPVVGNESRRETPRLFADDPPALVENESRTKVSALFDKTLDASDGATITRKPHDLFGDLSDDLFGDAVTKSSLFLPPADGVSAKVKPEVKPRKPLGGELSGSSSDVSARILSGVKEKKVRNEVEPEMGGGLNITVVKQDGGDVAVAQMGDVSSTGVTDVKTIASKNDLEYGRRSVEDDGPGRISPKRDSPGKLKHSLNINVAALMPGAAPARKKQADVTLERSGSWEDPGTATNQDEGYKKAEPAVFQDEGSVETLHSVTKSRARIQVKRKPSTRRGRQESLLKKNSEDTNENNGETLNSEDFSNNVGQLEERSNLFEQNSNFIEQSEDSNLQKDQKGNEKKQQKSNKTNTDENFGTSKQNNKQHTGSIIDNTNTKAIQNQGHLVSTSDRLNNNQPIARKSVFDDDDDDDDGDLFATTTSVVKIPGSTNKTNSKGSLFDDVDDLFGDTKKLDNETNEHKTGNDVKVIQKSELETKKLGIEITKSEIVTKTSEQETTTSEQETNKFDAMKKSQIEVKKSDKGLKVSEMGTKGSVQESKVMKKSEMGRKGSKQETSEIKTSEVDVKTSEMDRKETEQETNEFVAMNKPQIETEKSKMGSRVSEVGTKGSNQEIRESEAMKKSEVEVKQSEMGRKESEQDTKKLEVMKKPQVEMSKSEMGSNESQHEIKKFEAMKKSEVGMDISEESSKGSEMGIKDSERNFRESEAFEKSEVVVNKSEISRKDSDQETKTFEAIKNSQFDVNKSENRSKVSEIGTKGLDQKTKTFKKSEMQTKTSEIGIKESEPKTKMSEQETRGFEDMKKSQNETKRSEKGLKGPIMDTKGSEQDPKRSEAMKNSAENETKSLELMKKSQNETKKHETRTKKFEKTRTPELGSKKPDQVKPTRSLFDDDDASSDTDMFKSKKPSGPTKPSIFGNEDDDDGDFFTATTKKDIFGASGAKKKVAGKRGSLFDDVDEDEDIFGNASLGKTQKVSKPIEKRQNRIKPAIRKPQETAQAHDDPLDALK